MTTDSKPSQTSPSFSTARRWKIGFDTVIRTLLVLAVVVMANYMASLFSRQFYLSSQTRIHLNPRTVDILQTLTNRIDVTVYYNKDDGMYSTIMALLNEYHRLDPRITINVVDYLRDPAEAARVQQKYNLAPQGSDPNGPPRKNAIIFDCEGANPPRFKVAPGDALVQYGETGMTKDKKLEFRPVAFNGEKLFTSMLLAVKDPKPFTAYFVQGDGERSLTDSSENGYMKFAEVLQQNYIRIGPFSLTGQGDIPSDCDLLIIAGPQTPFLNSELSKIDHYLSQGGRLLVLLDYNSIKNPTGLEEYLAHWGVNVGMEVVQDSAQNATGSSFDIVVQNFYTHPVVNSLMQSKLEMILPRPVGVINNPNATADSPTATALAFSSADSTLYGQHDIPPRNYPLMVAVEQNSVKGIANATGNMRMVVAGDSYFLDNQVIEAGANRDFAGYAVNWLLERNELLNGLDPSRITYFRLLMTPNQVRDIAWLLLGALPGSVLAFGCLVWLRRRK